MSRSKWIVVPSRAVDLFELQRPFGISKGPVKTPIMVSMEKLRALLSQYNKPEVFEVIKIAQKTWPEEEIVWSAPVLLTLENYEQEYNVIAGTEPLVQVSVEETLPVVEETAVVVEEETEPVVEETEPVVEETPAEEVAPVVEEETATPNVPVKTGKRR